MNNHISRTGYVQNHTDTLSEPTQPEDRPVSGKKLLGQVTLITSAFAMLVACAPITPLPGGGSSLPIPTPSSGGSSGSPSGGGLPSPGGGSSGGGSPSGGGLPSPGGGSSGGGGLPGGGLPGGGLPGGGLPGGGLPGGQPGGSPGGQPGGSPGGDSGGSPNGSPGGIPGGSDPQGSNSGQNDPTWDIPEDGGGAGGSGDSGSGDDGWQTSNEIPGTPGSADGEGNSPGAGGSGGGAEGEAGEQGIPGGAGNSGDDELEGALKDFDGEILAERDILKTNPGASGGLELPTAETSAGSPGGGNSQAGGDLPPPKRAIPRAPAPPPRGSGSIPDNIPDAKDDDIIARQLREAALQEEDPVLKEKLWEEYRKYKKG